MGSVGDAGATISPVLPLPSSATAALAVAAASIMPSCSSPLAPVRGRAGALATSVATIDQPAGQTETMPRERGAPLGACWWRWEK